MMKKPHSAQVEKLITPGLVSDLEKLCEHRVFLNASLSEMSRWKIGGTADCIVRPNSTEQIAAILRLLRTWNLPCVVIGGTSNLLFADEGLRAVAIQIGSAMSSVKVDGDIVSCQSGAWVPGLARKLAQAGLSGAEHACGIPGTLGGLICMNGGSQSKGIGDLIVSVTSVDTDGNIVHRNRENCAFAYRCSIFQQNGEVITNAKLSLEPAVDYKSTRREMLNILSARRRKFPQKLPNCGSVFLSNPAMYADYGPPGVVIERLGFKNRRVGGALVSPQHANFIVNAGGASAADVLSLIAQIKDAVIDDIGLSMEVEVRYVTPSGKIVPVDSMYISSSALHESGGI